VKTLCYSVDNLHCCSVVLIHSIVNTVSASQKEAVLTFMVCVYRLNSELSVQWIPNPGISRRGRY